MSAKRSSALRARVSRARGESEFSVLGSSHANAYFNARRLNTATSQSQKKRRKTASNDGADAKEEEVEAKDSLAFKLRSVGELVETLRRVDERESAWRTGHPQHQWPSHEALFPKWLSQMHAGFSVLLHGVGTKLPLLQDFVATLPESEFIVEVHGYLPSVDMKEVVTMLRSEVYDLPVGGTKRSLVQSCRDIADYARLNRQRDYARVYLVVHSLDGPAMRTPELQASIAALAAAPTIHLIASIDSVNAPALWAEEGIQHFRWIHHRVDTLRPYVREIDLRLVREGKAAEQSISGVRYIMQSLTPTDVATLRVIAQHQLDCAVASTSRSRRVEKCADYHAVYVTCRKQLTHSTMQSMKNSIKCLEDNSLVQLIRVKNVEKLVIPLPDEVLREDIIPVSKSGSKP